MSYQSKLILLLLIFATLFTAQIILCGPLFALSLRIIPQIYPATTVVHPKRRRIMRVRYLTPALTLAREMQNSQTNKLCRSVRGENEIHV
jgi:hypothetical protein